SSRSSPARASSCSTRRPCSLRRPTRRSRSRRSSRMRTCPTRAGYGTPWRISLPTDAAVEPAADLAEVGRETRIALFRLMLLQRTAGDRIAALYRRGRISGPVYTGRGQEAVAAAAGLALGPDDVVAPLNRELACHFARDVTVAHVFRNFLGRG